MRELINSQEWYAIFAPEVLEYGTADNVKLHRRAFKLLKTEMGKMLTFEKYKNIFESEVNKNKDGKFVDKKFIEFIQMERDKSGYFTDHKQVKCDEYLGNGKKDEENLVTINSQSPIIEFIKENQWNLLFKNEVKTWGNANDIIEYENFEKNWKSEESRKIVSLKKSNEIQITKFDSGIIDKMVAKEKTKFLQSRQRISKKEMFGIETHYTNGYMVYRIEQLKNKKKLEEINKNWKLLTDEQKSKYSQERLVFNKSWLIFEQRFNFLDGYIISVRLVLVYATSLKLCTII